MHLNEILLNDNCFPSRTCDRDFRQDQEETSDLPIGEPKGLSAAVQRRRQIEQKSCVLFNGHKLKSTLPSQEGCKERDQV